MLEKFGNEAAVPVVDMMTELLGVFLFANHIHYVISGLKLVSMVSFIFRA